MTLKYPIPMSEEEFDRQSAAATRRGERRMKTEPLATAVKYDPRTRAVVVTLNKGHSISIPAQLLEGVATASENDRLQVEVLGPGIAIEFPTLDQQFGVTALLKGIFGFPPWMKSLAASAAKNTAPLESAKTRRLAAAQLGRRGGSATSDAKTAAARANGAKGGRPKKKPAAKS